MLHDLAQPPGAKAEQASLLATDDRDDRPIRSRHERHERREIEVAPDPNAVGDRLGELQRRPVVVQPRGEYCEALRAVTLEVVVEPLCDSVEVRLQPDTRVVRQLGPVGLLGLGEHGVHPRLCVAGRRHLRGIEVQIEADRASLVGAEGSELPQLRPRHRSGHRPPVGTTRA